MKLILVIIMFSSTAFADQYTEAFNTTQGAVMKATGLDKMLEDYGNEQLKKVNKKVQVVAGNLFLVGKILNERKATVKWEF